MGLTIHWSFKAPEDWSVAQVRGVLEKMRQRALDLPVESVGPVVYIGSDQMREHERDWMVIQADGSLDLPHPNGEGWRRSIRYHPAEMAGFTVDVGEGSESMEVVLARYPKTVPVDGKRCRTGKVGWSGRGFCKTQYASNVSAEHFVACHLSVVAMLDYAKELGILERVDDEGNYLDCELTTGPSPGKRSIEALVREVGEWNEGIAGLVASLGEFEPAGASHVAPIEQHPAFESLVAAGYSQERMGRLRAMLSASAVVGVQALQKKKSHAQGKSDE